MFLFNKLGGGFGGGGLGFGCGVFLEGNFGVGVSWDNCVVFWVYG